MAVLQFIAPRQRMVDPKTGIITREWFMFLQGLFNRVGGSNGEGTDDIVQSMPEDGGVEELKALSFVAFDAVNQAPPTTAPPTTDGDLSPPAIQSLIDDNISLRAELNGLRELVAELTKTVQDIQSGTIL